MNFSETKDLHKILTHLINTVYNYNFYKTKIFYVIKGVCCLLGDELWHISKGYHYDYR